MVRSEKDNLHKRVQFSVIGRLGKTKRLAEINPAEFPFENTKGRTMFQLAMASRLRHFARSLVVLLCLMSWLAIFNHCALAAIIPAPVDAHTCCEKSGEKSSPETSVICCKTLSSIQQADFSVPTQTTVALDTPALEFVDLLSRMPVVQVPLELEMTDPPGNKTAGRLDLERCHPALAPPLLH